MKLYEYIYDKHAKNSPILLEYEVEAEQHDVFYTINSCFGRLRNIPISLIGKCYNGERLYLNKPDIEKAKTLFVQAINSKIEAYNKIIETLHNERKTLLEFTPQLRQANLERDNMIQELRNYITSIPPREACDIVEDILGRDIETDELLLDAIEELWDIPFDNLKEAYQNCVGFKLSDIWDKVPHDRRIAAHVINMYDQGHSRKKNRGIFETI